VLFLATAILIYLRLRRKNKFAVIIFISITIISITVLLSDIIPRGVTDVMQTGSERIFSYITPSGVDLSETSGRGEVYSNAWKLIKEQPALGYGIFKYADISKGYPHNIFMEFLLQGGIVYLIFWIIVLIKFFIKFNRIIEVDNINLLLIPISIYPFTLLLFSGSYLMSALFWFVIAYVSNFKNEILPYRRVGKLSKLS
jgi:O-antigen ligase